ncbi:MAG: hypothetical protein DMG59_10295, partial [Acidobacteria bacterium]
MLAGNAPFQQQWQAQAASGSFGSLTNFGTITTTSSHLRNSYLQQYDLSIDYQLPLSMVASVAYIGSKGTHLAAFIPVNSFLPAALPAPATSVADETARLDQFKAASTSALRLDSRFSQVILITAAAHSNYNSLQ